MLKDLQCKDLNLICLAWKPMSLTLYKISPLLHAKVQWREEVFQKRQMQVTFGVLKLHCSQNRAVLCKLFFFCHWKLNINSCEPVSWAKENAKHCLQEENILMGEWEGFVAKSIIWKVEKEASFRFTAMIYWFSVSGGSTVTRTPQSNGRSRHRLVNWLVTSQRNQTKGAIWK